MNSISRAKAVYLFLPCILLTLGLHFSALAAGNQQAAVSIWTCMKALTNEQLEEREDRDFWRNTYRAVTLGNIGRAVWHGARGNWFPSAIGLRLEGKQIFGSKFGGRAARMIYKYREDFGLDFIVDDEVLARSEAGGLSDGMTVVLPTSFVRRPWLGTLMHEIEHCLNTQSDKPTRQLYFEVRNPKFRALFGSLIYYEGFRSDEVEARFADDEYYQATMRHRNLRIALILAEAQREYLNIFLASLPGFLVREYDDEKGKKKLYITLRQFPVDRDIMPEFPYWVRALPSVSIQLPRPKDFPTTSWKDQQEYLRQVFRDRLQELDSYAPKFESVKHLIPSK